MISTEGAVLFVVASIAEARGSGDLRCAHATTGLSGHSGLDTAEAASSPKPEEAIAPAALPALGLGDTLRVRAVDYPAQPGDQVGSAGVSLLDQHVASSHLVRDCSRRA
jgi:hypothetical protein